MLDLLLCVFVLALECNDGWVSQEVQLFWKVMETADQELRGKVLQFITGTSRVPLDGFIPPLTFTEATDLGPEALPKV